MGCGEYCNATKVPINLNGVRHQLLNDWKLEIRTIAEKPMNSRVSAIF